MSNVKIGAVIYAPKVTVIWGIIADFFKEEGFPVEPVFYKDYVSQIDGLMNGEIDIAWNSPLAWVDAYIRTKGKALDGSMRDTDRDRQTYLVVRKDSGIESIEDLKGKTIGVQLGSIQEQFAKDNGSVPKLYNNFTEALLDLQNQKIDAVIIAEVSGIEYLKTMKGIKKIDTIKDKLPSASIAFRKADSKLAKEFSDAILKLKDSPEYAKLVKKYFPEHYDNFIANQKKK